MARSGLIALGGQPPRVDANEAETVALSLYGLSVRAQPLDGERDRNFLLEGSDGRRWVLKFIDPGVDDDVVAGQCAVLAHLCEQAPDVPVPRIVATRNGLTCEQATTRSGPYRVRLITYLTGRLVSSLEPGPALLCALGLQMARLDHALRGFAHPALAQPIAWDIRRAPSLLHMVSGVTVPGTQRLVAEAIEPVSGLLPRLRALRAQAIHNDCHPRNLLADEAASRCTGIIDLGDMIHAPLVFEPAVAMAEFLNDGLTSLDPLAELLAGYTQVQPLEPEDIALIYPLIRARIGLGVLIQAWRSRNQPDRLMSGASAAARAQELARLDQFAARALEQLATRGQETLTAQWHDAAKTRGAARAPDRRDTRATATPRTLLRRRRDLLGAHAELSYEHPLHLVRGDGVWVYTSAGERLLDVYNNVPHVGHAHPAVVAAIAGQAGRIASNTRYLDERILDYSERLISTLPRELDACLFVNSGSEANDIAWRIAKSHTGHAGALVMTHAYHGITDAVSALSPAATRGKVSAHVEQLAAPVIGNIAALPADAAGADVHDALARLRNRGFGLAALMIDSALTSTGIYDPPPAWAAPIAAAVHTAGGLIIADEVQFGLGRCGSHFWGFSRRGYLPDIVTLGKPVANGYPVGIVVTRRALLEPFQRETGFFSTFGGNPVAGAAGLAVLQVLESERLIENAGSTGDYFIDRLRQAAALHPALAEVRGCGLLLGVEVADLPGRSATALTKQLVNGLRERGVLIGAEGPHANVLKLRPPMPFRREHVDIVMDALVETLRATGC